METPFRALKSVNATLYRKLKFIFLRDIDPVASVTRQPQVLLVDPSVAAKSVPELIDFAKANPGRITMASSGVASIGHLTDELFKITAGVDFVHVPYRGAGPAFMRVGSRRQVEIAAGWPIDRTSRTALRGSGRHRVCALAGRIRQAPCRRNGEVGQGGSGGQHQVGIDIRPNN